MRTLPCSAVRARGGRVRVAVSLRCVCCDAALRARRAAEWLAGFRAVLEGGGGEGGGASDEELASHKQVG